MAERAAENERYWAFISYSHKDSRFGRRLHRALETYRLPARLVGRSTRQGVVPRRLALVFRDREELPASHDLSQEVRAALGASGSLIVLCSPDARASQWVASEVEVFRALYPDRPVLAAIVRGDPAECFPSVLVRDAAGDSVEPLAADFRRGHDGWHLGLLKLMAGIVGLRVDELVQRDSQRRVQRVTAVTAGAMAAVVGMGALTLFALTAQREAEHQRQEAERLIGFMSTDLREKLRGVGRLDVMSVVNQTALAYFDRERNAMTPDSRARRALLLEALGEDDENRGNHAAALPKFRQAFAVTAQLLARDPQNPERVFDHAQSMYWMGFDAYARGDVAGARPHFENYRKLAEKLVTLAPREGRSWHEFAYAEGNLCALAFERPPHPKLALQLCSEALGHMESAASRLGRTDLIKADLANRHAWLADAYRALGDDAHALRHRLINEQLMQELMKSDPGNMDFKIAWIAVESALAKLEAHAAQPARAIARLQRASAVIDDMVRFDPANSSWRDQRTWVAAQLSDLQKKH
jgi:hypothetical protein